MVCSVSVEGEMTSSRGGVGVSPEAPVAPGSGTGLSPVPGPRVGPWEAESPGPGFRGAELCGSGFRAAGVVSGSSLRARVRARVRGRVRVRVRVRRAHRDRGRARHRRDRRQVPDAGLHDGALAGGRGGHGNGGATGVDHRERDAAEGEEGGDDHCDWDEQPQPGKT
ncbi:hypothetical protein GCM10018952_18120 [Streptosporangium vulgare]